MQGSGGLLTKYSFGECRDPADCPTEYSFSVYRVQADYLLNIQLVYAGVQRITDRIFIWCMQGSGGFPTEYSVGVCRDPADCPTEYSFSVYRVQVDHLLNIQLVYAGVQRIVRLNIHSVYEWVRRIAN
jgi:hypothetical protein